MADQETEAEFKQRFMQRVKAARAALGWKQWQMADALGMSQDKYKTYEVRTYLPHHLIGRFCLITRVDPEWLVTGRGEKPLQPVKLVEQEEAEHPPKKAKTRKVA
jgi:DNA-binding XRE family transcriptional regulator